MRDHRIDFFRGLALIVIFVDHIPYNVYSYLTPRNYGLSDAAEIFVFVSGVSAAYAYYGRFSGGEPLLASARALRRAGVLYVAQLFGTVAMLGMFSAAYLWFDRPQFIEDNNIGVVFSDPVRGFAGIASLGHQLGYFNILPMYLVFLLALPAMMIVARRNLALLLFLSFLLYAAAGTFRLNVPNFPTEGGWYFNPLAWQFLFVVGFVCGVRLRSGEGIAFHPVLWLAAFAYVSASALWVVLGLWGTLPDLPLPFLLYGSDKTFLTAGRLLHVLALAYVVAESPLAAVLKRRLGPANPVVLLGKHALVTFCLGTLLSMLGLILKVGLDGGPAFDTVYVASGLFVLVAAAASLEFVEGPRQPATPAMTAREVPAPAPLAQAE